MVLNSWIIKSWPILDCPVSATDQRASLLRHVGTQMSFGRDDDGCNIGHTLWAFSEEGTDYGVAWDWTEIMPGVPVITDPMRLLTNLLFIVDDGMIASEAKAAVEVNRIVHSLPWQIEVCREIRGQNDGPKTDASREISRSLIAARRFESPLSGVQKR